LFLMWLVFNRCFWLVSIPLIPHKGAGTRMLAD
jgi:hypothetical protein